MSTLRATNIKHESSATNQIVLGADGSIGGTLGDTLAAKANTADLVAPGLVLVASQSFSATSSVSINNCFSSTYQDYRVLFTGVGSAPTNALLFRMRASGSDSTTSYAQMQVYQTEGGGPFRAYATGQVAGILGNIGERFMMSDVAMASPNEASRTVISGTAIQYSTAYATQGSLASVHDVVSAYDGITVYPSSGTITGNIRIYGYKNS